MSKKLTEKFQDGSFKYGIYYCKTEEDGIKRIKKLELYHDGCDHGYAKTFGCNDDYPYEDIKEVLAPVPTYEEYQKLKEQLADANKVIDYYDEKDFHYILADGTVMGKEPAHKYKLKWSVK